MTTMTHPDPTAPTAPSGSGLGLPITTRGLSLRYGSTTALDEVTLDLAPGRIHGLLGRNGAGKTTLLSVLASFLPASSGSVQVGGRDPFEDEERMSQICLVRDTGDLVADEMVSWSLDLHEMIRPSFDRPYADHLLSTFGVSPDSKPQKLSRGQRSAVSAAIGLASRAPVTMFDEVTLGMDAPSRERFAELLIAEVAERPRTVVLSSHLIQEVEQLLETVTILHRGRVLLSDEADEVHRRGITITGPAAAVGPLTDRLDVIASRDLGGTRQVTAYGDTDPAVLDAAERDGLEVGAAPLQDLFIHLTEEPS